MAKAKKAKIKKASTQPPLDDMRWRPASEITKRLLSLIGNRILVAHDLTEALVSEKIRCMRRSIRMGHVDVDKLCDTELEQKILGEAPLNEPSAAEHFSELLHRQLFEPFARVRASHGVITPKLIIAAMGGDAGMILVNGITLGQYVERLAAEANLPRTPGHGESVRASFWAEHCLVCSPNGDIGVGFHFPPNHHEPSEPSSTLTANWAFYLWQPDCVKVWRALTPQEIDARKAKPRPARKRSTRKASQRVGMGSAIEAGDSAASSGSPYATEVGDTAAVAGRLKRKRRGKLTAEQISAGRAYLRDQPLKPKQAYPRLRNVLKSAVSDATLWRAFFRK